MRAAPVVLQLSTVASTMDALHELAQGGAAAGSVVVADEQAAGRGSRGRHWSSPPGGLWLSLLARPATTGLEVLSLRAGLAVAERLGALGIHLALKWPNDLMLGSGKLGGILTEARWHADTLAWIVAGVGINVRNELPTGAVPAAARLRDAGVTLAPVELAGPVASVVAGATRTAEPLSPEELTEFALRDWLHGRRLNAPAVGTAEGISPGGLLRIRKHDGAVVEVFGSVALAPATRA